MARSVKQSTRSGSASGEPDGNSFAGSRSEDEMSDDADLLEVGEVVVVGSDSDRENEAKRENETIECSTDRSNGEEDGASSLESGSEISSQFNGDVSVDSSRESEHEVTNGDVNSGNEEASVSVQNRSDETRQEKREGKEMAEEEDEDCCVKAVHAVTDGANKKTRRRNNNFNLLGTMPVGWRTRSYTKNTKRVDYTIYYRNISRPHSDSEVSVEEIDTESCTNSDSGSDKKGFPLEERSKYGKHSKGKVSAHNFGEQLQPKWKGTCKRVRTSATSSECLRDIDNENVPILERLNKIRKQGSIEERCRQDTFQNSDVISSSSSDDADTMTREVRKTKRVAKEKQFYKSKYKKKKQPDIHDNDLFDFFMRTLDADGEEAESSQPTELPMLFNFESSNEPLVEKSDFEKHVDEAWQDFDFALGVENLGNYQPDEATASRDAVYIATGNYCLHGEHEMHLDEQIGYKCRNCSYIETEIRYIFPGFATSARKAPDDRNQKDSGDTLMHGDLHQNSENQEVPEFSFPKTGTVWDLIPGLLDTLYPHQKEAFEFMWQNLAGSIQLDELHSVASQSDKHGCVISHAPGTGKTRLAIVFIQSYMKAFPNCNPVVIAPANLLKTWDTEFKKWSISLPFYDMNSEDFTSKEEESLIDKAREHPHTKRLARMIKLSSWCKGKGVLGISYTLFNKYVSEKSNKRSNARLALVDKPGLLILDEGHIPRNENSQLWNALSEVKTEKRIILSGTPFQNSFIELYNTLCIVRPAFVKNLSLVAETPKKKESLLHKTKQKPIKDIWTTPTRYVTASNAEVVRAILKPFVHVYNGEILKSLPGIRECVIVLNPEVIQRDVIRKLGQAKNSCTFDHECKISLASIHPCLLASATLTEREASLIDKAELKNLRDDPNTGVKTKFVVEFIRLLGSSPLQERVLIFSQYVRPLKLIMKQLTKMFTWTEGSEVIQVHGKIPLKERERSIASFNDMHSKARVLLASTKACSEGISLIGASRVVLLDVVWNPSVGKQAISRAFRIGQQRVVYTYNLITDGTDEMEKYNVQMQKEKLSKLVFSPKDVCAGLHRHSINGEGDICDLVQGDMVLEAMARSEVLEGMFANIHYTKSNDWSGSVQV